MVIFLGVYPIFMIPLKKWFFSPWEAKKNTARSLCAEIMGVHDVHDLRSATGRWLHWTQATGDGLAAWWDVNIAFFMNFIAYEWYFLVILWDITGINMDV